MSPEDIDKLTIAEVRAIAERASDALKTLRELGMMGTPVAAPPAQPQGLRTLVLPSGAPAPTDPFPCAACGRTATEKPGEPVSPIECQLCGNHLPATAGGALVSNKGPLVMDSDMLARRQALIAQPAFGPDGEPA